MIVVGIDPDTDKHGVAIYKHGKLIGLNNWELPRLVYYIAGMDQDITTFAIEDVNSQNFIYSRNVTGKKKVDQSIARSVGKCQQAQVELMRMLDYYKVPYKLYKPQRGNWADNKAQFQKLTGWKKQSNENTRSAAYFGFLALAR